MLETFKARLHGDHVTWTGDVPEIAESETGVDVFVTILVKESDEPKAKRPSGLAKGEFVVPDDFDAPLSGELLSDFEN